jgi:Ca2+-binding RTX toxin-like protein
VAKNAINRIIRTLQHDDFLGTEGNDLIDLLYCGAGDDFILGRWGNDRFWGGAGNDALLSQDGNDVLTGGRGADLFAISVGGGWVAPPADGPLQG